jgi:hypothetical protein
MRASAIVNRQRRRVLTFGITAIMLLSPVASALAQFSFDPPLAYSLQGTQISRAVVVADLNGDSFDDVAVSTDTQIQVFLNRKDGALAQPSAVYPVSSGGSIVAADLNGDGIADIAFNGAGGLGVLINVGDGTFRAPQYFASGTGLVSAAVTAAHYFHDGRSSVAVLEVGLFGCCSTLTVFRSQTDGTFVKASQMGLAAGAAFIISTDVDRDGFSDLITANGNGGSTVSVLKNTKDGRFQPPVDYPAAGARGVAAADLNGDGLPDLLLFASNDVRLGIALNHGDGTFGPTTFTPYNPFTRISDLAVADFDGDGTPDIAPTPGGSSDRVAQISVQRGTGAGRFEDVPFGLLDGLHVGPLATIDLDGDGVRDILMVDNSTLPASASRILVLLNRTPSAIGHFGLSVDHGGNVGSITLTVFGSDIPQNSTLKLACDDQVEILGTHLVVAADGKSITGSLDLAGVTPG